MKIKIYLSVMLFSLLMVACNQSEEIGTIIDGGDRALACITPIEAISIAFDNPKQLSDDEIIEMVRGFTQTNSSTRSVNNSPKISVSQEYLLGLSPSDAFTRSEVTEEKIKFSVVDIVNDENDKSLNGFAIVCADERYPAVLAYVDQGNYNSIKGSPSELMLLRAQSVALSYIAQANNLKSQLRFQTIEKVCNDLGITTSEFNYDRLKSKLYVKRVNIEENETRGTVVPNPGGAIMGQVGPLCGTTRIIQGWPCNQYIPEVDVNKYGPVWQTSQHHGHYPAGCVNVALATMCTFFRPNIYSPELQRNIDWSYVYNCYFNPFAMNSSAYEEDTAQAIEVARLLQVISTGTHTEFNEKGGNTSNQNAASYMNSIGINMGTNLVDVNYLNIRPSLNSYGLVYVTGQGRTVQSRGEGIEGAHAWVIDGYQVRSRVARQELQNYNCYVNCNFGWIEPEYSPWFQSLPCNGWYLCDYNGAITSFDVTQQYGSVYDIGLKCIVNIKKK